jgi:hypothetical protein
MSEVQHTPGPWAVPFNGKCQAWQESRYPFLWHASVHTNPITREDGQCTAILGHRCYGATQSEAEANARLIAAAPDLLAACEKCLKHIHDEGEDHLLNSYEFTDALHNAIAKAKGTR